MPDLADFAGLWRLTRAIEDRLGPPGRFEGVARFDPVPGGLDYRERGQLQVGTAAFGAERRYLWRQAEDGVVVFFEDGRAFHSFDPRDPDPRARHDCAPDLYLVRYDFGAWPEWSTEWQVSGPRKDYRMRSHFVRQG